MHLLSRYDGNANIAQIRIATGLMGEDNPLIGPVLASAAGFGEQSWLRYSTALSRVYFSEFSLKPS